MSTYGALLFWLQRGPMSWIKRLWMMITKSIQSASNYQINEAPIRFINFMSAKTLKVCPDHIPRPTKKIHLWQIPAWSSSDQLWLDIPLMALWLDIVLVMMMKVVRDGQRETYQVRPGEQNARQGEPVAHTSSRSNRIVDGGPVRCRSRANNS